MVHYIHIHVHKCLHIMQKRTPEDAMSHGAYFESICMNESWCIFSILMHEWVVLHYACVAVCSSVLQCVTTCCNVCCSVRTVCRRNAQISCVAVCMQCVAGCCSVLQCVAVCCNMCCSVRTVCRRNAQILCFVIPYLWVRESRHAFSSICMNASRHTCATHMYTGGTSHRSHPAS